MKKGSVLLLAVIFTFYCVFAAGCAKNSQEEQAETASITDFSFLLGEWYSLDDESGSTYCVVTEDEDTIYFEFIANGAYDYETYCNKDSLIFADLRAIPLLINIFYYEDGDFLQVNDYDADISLKYVRETKYNSIYENNEINDSNSDAQNIYHFDITDIFGSYISEDGFKGGDTLEKIYTDGTCDTLNITLDESMDVNIYCTLYRTSYFTSRIPVRSLIKFVDYELGSFWILGDWGNDYGADSTPVTITFYDESQTDFSAPAIYVKPLEDLGVSGWFVMVSHDDVTMEDIDISDKQLPNLDITATELLNEYSENSIRAKENWSGKFVLLAGEIRSISEECIEVKGSSGYNTIYCYFGKGIQYQKLLDLNVGDTVRIIGNIRDETTFFDNIVIQNCIIYEGNYEVDSAREHMESMGYQWSNWLYVWMNKDGISY